MFHANHFIDFTINFFFFYGYLRCRNVTACYATATILTANMDEIIEGHPHSAACVPDPHAMEVARFRDALKQQIMTGVLPNDAYRNMELM